MNSPLILRNILTTARSYALKHNYSTETDVIKIPKKIQRGPTDILRALARTHKRDPTAPQYKYHDDPYLIPYSNSSKRSYALSLEAGRKAAHWILHEHADLFNHSVADPQIEIFVPSKIYNEDTEVTVEDLKKTISNFSVADSITIYNSLEKQGIEVDDKIKQSLLELLCYYNCEDGINEEWFEERWFRATNQRKDFIKNTWNSNSLAEQIFRSIKPPTCEAYCAIISGMAKFGQIDGAMHLFDEACSNNMPLSVTVYNHILQRMSSYKERHDLMWEMTINLLNKMKSNQLKPTLATFNSIIETLSCMPTYKNAKKYTLQLLSEMKGMQVEPSLATFYHILNAFYRGPQNSGILYSIIDYLDGKSLEVKDIDDCLFFVTAMEYCRFKLHDVSLGYRINKLLHQDENYNLLGDSFRESKYYRFFFTLLCEGEPLDEFMKVYDDLVPNLYTPEPSVMMDLLNSIEVNMAYYYIPKIWTDMVQFDLSDRQMLLAKVLELMTQVDDAELNKQFVKIGWSIWDKLESQTRERNPIEWTSAMLCNILKLLINNNELAKANFIFDKLDRNQNNLSGEPDTGVLRAYVTSCVENKSLDMAIKCVRYCKDMGFGEADEFAVIIESSPALSDQQKLRMNNLLGKSPS